MNYKYNGTITINVDDETELELGFSTNSLDEYVARVKADNPTVTSVVIAITL